MKCVFLGSTILLGGALCPSPEMRSYDPKTQVLPQEDAAVHGMLLLAQAADCAEQRKLYILQHKEEVISAFKQLSETAKGAEGILGQNPQEWLTKACDPGAIDQWFKPVATTLDRFVDNPFDPNGKMVDALFDIIQDVQGNSDAQEALFQLLELLADDPQFPKNLDAVLAVAEYQSLGSAIMDKIPEPVANAGSWVFDTGSWVASEGANLFQQLPPPGPYPAGNFGTNKMEKAKWFGWGGLYGSLWSLQKAASLTCDLSKYACSKAGEWFLRFDKDNLPSVNNAVIGGVLWILGGPAFVGAGAVFAGTRDGKGLDRETARTLIKNVQRIPVKTYLKIYDLQKLMNENGVMTHQVQALVQGAAGEFKQVIRGPNAQPAWKFLTQFARKETSAQSASRSLLDIFYGQFTISEENSCQPQAFAIANGQELRTKLKMVSEFLGKNEQGFSALFNMVREQCN